MMLFLYLKVLFVLSIGIVPDGFHKYLQYGVQVGYEYKQHNEEKGECYDRYHLQERHGNIGEYPGDDERKDNEDNGSDKSADVDKK